MCYSSEEPSTVWKETRRLARKTHSCSDCGDTIEAGSEYDHIGSLYNGRWDTLRVCSTCIFMRAWVYATEIADEGCGPNESMITTVGGDVIHEEYRRLMHSVWDCSECGYSRLIHTVMKRCRCAEFRHAS